MERIEKITQIRVGIFLAIGLAALASTVVYFGRIGDGIRKYYELRVEYPNASGLLKGSSVFLAGAKIGIVNTAPQMLPDMDGVFVMLRIYDEVRIPSASTFAIGSSGLLGDRFVQILLGEGARNSPPISPGAVIRGRGESGGIGALADGAGDVLAEVRTAVQSINSLAQKLDSQLLDPAAMEKLRSSLKNIEVASAAIAESSGRLGDVMEDARKAVDSGGEAMMAIKTAAGEFQKTMTDFRALLAQTRQGRGLLGALLNDQEMAANARALAANLRQHGILWYRDSAPKETPRRRP